MDVQNVASHPIAGEGDEGATAKEGGWEAELESQRDAALAMARELSYQLDRQRETLERRARMAEALRDSSSRARRELQDNMTRRNQSSEALRVRLAGLVGGSLSAWLLCIVLGLTWSPQASLALGLPCTLAMAALCSRRLPALDTQRSRGA